MSLKKLCNRLAIKRMSLPAVSEKICTLIYDEGSSFGYAVSQCGLCPSLTEVLKWLMTDPNIVKSREYAAERARRNRRFKCS